MCCAAAVATATAAPPLMAAGAPNVMIMGQDADRDTVPCNSRVFEAVRRAVVSQLDQQGYNVFDETAALGPNFTAGRCRRADDELIDVLRAVTRPPLDVAVLLRMYATVEELTYTARVRARISGRLLNVATGQDLDGFEVRSPEEWTMRVDCARERACMLEDLARYGTILANDLGAVLALKLDALARAGEVEVTACLHKAYTLIFDGYTTDDVRLAEEYLVAFKDYQKHRTSRVSPRRREYWYKSCIDSARLTRNFAEMFKFMNTPSTIDFSPSRNTFTLTKIPMRKRR
jgi:hypothetical protein